MWVFRSVAQLVEHRSPKPGVMGSSPFAPAILFVLKSYKIYFSDCDDSTNDIYKTGAPRGI